MSSKNKGRRAHRDRDRGHVKSLWDDSRQYYANDQEHRWGFEDGTSNPYEQAATRAPDIRAPRSAVDTSYCSDREGNDLNSQFSDLDVSQEDYHNATTGYAQSYNDSPTDEHHETHYTSRTQRPDSFDEEQNGSAAQGPTPQPQYGSLWDPMQTTYEAHNSAVNPMAVSAMEQRLSTSIPNPTYYPPTYGGRDRCPSDDQQSYPSIYSSTPTYGAQQSSVFYGSQYDASSVPYGSQYDTAQQPYPKTHDAPYSVLYPDDAFGSSRNITDPRLYKKGITAFARVSLNRMQKKQKMVGVELRAYARLGTVFKIPCSESSAKKSGHDEMSEGPFRWFVVVLEPSKGTEFYSCVPITTYQGHGPDKAGIVLSAHAQIGGREYIPQVSGMGETIRFKSKVYGSSMPHGSLVNFDKVYSIDGDVRAVEFGKVDKDQRQSLLTMLEGNVHINLTEEERNRRQVEDRNRWERNQDDFADD